MKRTDNVEQIKRVGPLDKSQWREGDFLFFQTLTKEMIMWKEHNDQNKRPAGPKTA